MMLGELREAIGTVGRDGLPAIKSALWAAFGAGQISEEQAAELQGAIDARDMLPAAQRPRRRTPIRPSPTESMQRRRRWAAAGRMPPRLADKFTLGEQAALAVVAVEAVKRGACMLAIGAIAALAGVSETTVRRALRQAKVLGLAKVDERRLSRFRNDTNVVTIVSLEWKAWLRLGGGCQNGKGTNTKVLNKGRQRASGGALRAAGGQGRTAVEPQIRITRPART